MRIGTVQIQVPAVMGVLNVTPDSFSDGGRFISPEAALRRAELLCQEGAAIIDIGGESTRPGADAVAEQEELDRVMPVIERIHDEFDVPISIDTGKPGVMRAAAAAGAAMINDVYALRLEGALDAAVDLHLPVCLMHMQGKPRTMQEDPHYDDVVADVMAFLRDRADACIEAGLAEDQLLVDPGFGFGKRPVHNIELLGNLRQLRELNYPIVVGLSRKATLGDISGQGVDGRLAASLAAAVLAVVQGASIVRAHDVGATVDAIKVVRAVMETSTGL